MRTTIHPVDLKLIDFAGAKRMYRGMSTPQATWAPREPLFASSGEWERWALSLLTIQLAYEHVLAPLLKQGKKHAVSLSCSSGVARCYALSSEDQLYAKGLGYVGIFQLAPLRSVHTYGGLPFLYIRADNTVWLDPRNLPPSTQHYAAALDTFECIRSSAQADNEILLVLGTLSASRVLSAKRIPRFGKQHMPWQHVVTMSAPQLGLSTPQPSSFLDLHRRTEEERAVAARLSVLNG